MTPRLRASHTDRDLAVEILCAAAGEGRLTAAELDERLETALTARTVGELAAVTADLPGGAALQAVCQPLPTASPLEVPLGACPPRTPLQVFQFLIHYDDHAQRDPSAHAGPGPVIPDAPRTEARLEPGASPARAAGQDTWADTEQRAASRWALLQSLANRPRPYGLLAG